MKAMSHRNEVICRIRHFSQQALPKDAHNSRFTNF